MPVLSLLKSSLDLVQYMDLNVAHFADRQQEVCSKYVLVCQRVSPRAL